MFDSIKKKRLHMLDNIISKKIYIIGAGAIGALIGGRLTQKFGKDNVILIDTDIEHVEAIRQNGLIIFDKGQKNPQVETIDANIMTPDQVDKSKMDYVILATKTYSNHLALEGLGEKIPMLILQNGYDERLWCFPYATRGIEFGFACQVKEPGYISNAVKGKYVLGNPQHNSIQVKSWARLLNAASIKAETKSNIEGYLWSKLLINSTLNPLSAIRGYSFKDIIESPRSRQMFRELYLEGYPIVKRKAEDLDQRLGAFIGPPEFVNRIFQSEKVSDFVLKMISEKFGEVESSMLQDIRKKRPTEIDTINGAIIRLGRKYGVETPKNNWIVNEVKKLEPISNLN